MPVFFPDTVTLSLQRYKVNKWDEIEKDRTNIYPDFYVNFKKYTTREEEMIYALESVVLHKGEQPTSGHYTALRKAQGSFILMMSKFESTMAALWKKMDTFSFIHL